MYKKIILTVLTATFIFSCSSPKKDKKAELIDSITKLEQQCFDESTNTYNHKIALKTLNEYQKFIKDYPTDSLTANYMYVGGQLCKSINLYGEAIHQFEDLIKKFPKYKKGANAKFMIGMIYENDIQDTLKAKEAYQEFINEYPNSDLIDDAQFLIQNLSLTDEQLIEMLESKNKKDSII